MTGYNHFKPRNAFFAIVCTILFSATCLLSATAPALAAPPAFAAPGANEVVRPLA